MNQHPPSTSTRHLVAPNRRPLRTVRSPRRFAAALAAASVAAVVAGAAGPVAASTPDAARPAAPLAGWTSADGLEWEHSDGRVVVVAWPRSTN